MTLAPRHTRATTVRGSMLPGGVESLGKPEYALPGLKEAADDDTRTLSPAGDKAQLQVAAASLGPLHLSPPLLRCAARRRLSGCRPRSPLSRRRAC